MLLDDFGYAKKIQTVGLGVPDRSDLGRGGGEGLESAAH